MNTTEQTQEVSTNTEAHDIEVIVAEEPHSVPNIEDSSQIPIKESENISTEGYIKSDTKLTRNLRLSTTSSEANEEVDDIELIFSSDDKEHIQEDLVSISEFEPWEKAGSAGTPVLVNFNVLSSSEELNNKSKKKEMNMEMDQEGQENRTDMKRNESVDTFDQVWVMMTTSLVESGVNKF